MQQGCWQEHAPSTSMPSPERETSCIHRKRQERPCGERPLQSCKATLVGLGQGELLLKQGANFRVSNQDCTRTRFVLLISNAVHFGFRIKLFMSNLIHLQECIVSQRKFALANSYQSGSLEVVSKGPLQCNFPPVRGYGGLPCRFDLVCASCGCQGMVDCKSTTSKCKVTTVCRLANIFECSGRSSKHITVS